MVGKLLVAAGLTLCSAVACLRQLVARLKNGQSVAVIADAFCIRRTCPVTFLGWAVRGSLLGARLAALAGVPLQPAAFVWERGALHPRFGSPLNVARDRESQTSATVSVLQFLEGEIRRTPAAWNKALKPPELW
jgi:lauroyl/myristoyl acyltransferase